MSSGTLYTVPGPNFRAHKSLIAAQYSGFNLKIADEFVFGETNKSRTFVQKFPAGKVPALETADNVHIFESNAIAHYVGNEQLRGKTIKDQSEILQWINFVDSEILPSACTWLFPCFGIMAYNKRETEHAKKDVKKALSVLNTHLLTRTYLVGERITQADITVSCTLLNLYQHVFESNFRSAFPEVNRWFITLVNQPEFQAVLGEVKLCTKMAEFDSEKFAELQKTTRETKKSESEEPKPQPQEKPQQQEKSHKHEKQPESKKEKSPPVEELDETELALAAEPKSNDPFAKFPKGNFNMDEFKRVYSNESETVSLKYFWEKFDVENYSIWYCEYLYPEELTLTFMSCNLIGGMFQRLDKMRKNAFGSVCLFGEDNKSTISGVWFWKGDELAFTLSQDWQIDYESYSWRKLDFKDPETKKLVDEYFSWAGDFGGKKFNQGKIFK